MDSLLPIIDRGNLGMGPTGMLLFRRGALQAKNWTLGLPQKPEGRAT